LIKFTTLIDLSVECGRDGDPDSVRSPAVLGSWRVFFVSANICSPAAIMPQLLLFAGGLGIAVIHALKILCRQNGRDISASCTSSTSGNRVTGSSTAPLVC
jgi:hypothetical protein